MSVKWNAFFPRVMPEVKGCPAPIVVQAIRDAAREFCERTWVWQEVVPFQMDEGMREIFIASPRGSRLVSVRHLIEDNREVDFPDDIFVRSDREMDKLRMESSETKQSSVRAVFKPSEDADSCPDFLYNDHAEAISYGAKYRLLSNPSKPWGMPEMAMVHLQMFRKSIAQVKIYLRKGYTGKSLKVKPRRFV